MPSNCWCMWWRERTGDAKRNKQAMKGVVGRDDKPGLIAYEDGDPVGWVSVAPREAFGQLMRSRSYGPCEEEKGVWSITCFYVDPRAKGHGVRESLLEAAVSHAIQRGARVIEAYPHEKGDYMGSPSALKRNGFKRVRKAGTRMVMRRDASVTKGKS